MERTPALDLIPFDGDGRVSPDVEPEDAAALRATWRAMNAAEVPQIR